MKSIEANIFVHIAKRESQNFQGTVITAKDV